ncbi:MAG: F0F1 ATP synthase subunit epsilon [Varibaculum sp.]|nr:F0F1 ATP synthase subunit epsilon [Varibaculum sp.]
MASLQVMVVNHREVLWEGEASYISAPSMSGSVGVLPGRQPLLAALQSGTVEIAPSSGDRISFDVENGFISVDTDLVNVVLD